MKIGLTNLFLILLFLRSLFGFGADAPDLVSFDPVEFESAELCSNCHEKIYNAWDESAHSKTWDNLVYHAARSGFMKASSSTGILYCEKCHAPIADLIEDKYFMERVSTEGVTCDVCHTVGPAAGSDSTGLRPIGGREKAGPGGNCPSELHGCREEPFLSSHEFCATCHLFVNRSGVSIYTEYTDWKNSIYYDQGVGCGDCHVKDDEDNAGIGDIHRFVPLEGTQGLLQKAVTMSIGMRHYPETVLYINLKNTGSAHAVPGGPPIRSLRIEVRGYNEIGSEVYSDTTTVISRVVEGPIDPDTGLVLPWLGWNEARDDRLYPGQSRSYSYRTERIDIVRAVAKLFYVRASMTVEEDFFGDDDLPLMASAEARSE